MIYLQSNTSKNTQNKKHKKSLTKVDSKKKPSKNTQNKKHKES